MTDAAPEVLQPLKTWSHLADRRRRPTEYEIVSTNLHYRQNNPDSPWELDPNIHMNKWYRQYCNDSPLKNEDWDEFRDPDQLVYRTYNILQDGQETHVRSVLEQFSSRDHDAGMSSTWAQLQASHYAPARYLFHTVQMISAYLSQMAPASTISNCTTFQAADSLRWLTHTAYRTVELGRAHTGEGFGENERTRWESDPAWQGFRELMEKGLVAWDWAESFAFVNLVAKPAIEGAVISGLAAVAGEEGDIVMTMLAESQLRDAERHRRWAGALVEMALQQESNRAVLQGWITKWQPMADAAVEAYCAELPSGDAIASRAKDEAAAFRAKSGLS